MAENTEKPNLAPHEVMSETEPGVVNSTEFEEFANFCKEDNLNYMVVAVSEYIVACQSVDHGRLIIEDMQKQGVRVKAHVRAIPFPGDSAFTRFKKWLIRY